MKIQKLVAPLGVTALAIGMAAATVAPASAINNIKPFGQPESLNDSTGAPMITYTVHGLNPSSDAVFHNGQLYEANVTFEGGIPIAPMFNARAESGANYRVIGGGLPGKLYFDVVGDIPNSVVYNDGGQDLLVGCPVLSRAVPIPLAAAPPMPQESPPRSSVGHLLKAVGYLLKALQQGATRPSPRSSRRPPSSSPNRRWLSQGSMQFPAGIADCSVT